MARGKWGKLSFASAVTCLALMPAGSAGAADKIAFTCGNSDGDLCLVDPDSLDPVVPLTGTPDDAERYPSWSPDGSTIAFNGLYSPSNWDVFTINPANLEEDLTNVTVTPARGEDGVAPQWSPDGTRLTFATDTTAGDAKVWVSAASGTSAPLPIGDTASPSIQERRPVWSPDGTKIAYSSSNSGINTAFADGSGTPQPVLGLSGGVIPAWSPDGSKIAAVLSNSAVVVANASGSATPLVLQSPSSSLITSLSWSPDGTRLMWHVDSAIRIERVDGSSPSSDVVIPALVGNDPAWSPDGTRIAYEGLDSGDFYVLVAGADGSPAPTRVNGTLNGRYPDWKPGPLPPVTPTNPGGTNPPGPTAPGPTPPRPVLKFSLKGLKNLRLGPGAGFLPPIRMTCFGAFIGQITETGCKVDAIGTLGGPAQGSPGGRGRAGKVVFTRGALTVPLGKTKPLKLKITSAGKKLLKPGKKLRVKLAIRMTTGGEQALNRTQAITIKVKGKKQG